MIRFCSRFCYSVFAMNNPTVLNTPAQIQAFRLLTLRSALKLEILGMKRRGPSAHSIIKKEFNLKGDRCKVFIEFSDMLSAWGTIDRMTHVQGAVFIKNHQAKKRDDLKARMAADSDDELKKQEYAEEVASGQHDGC